MNHKVLASAGLARAIIKQVWDETATVRGIRLHLPDGMTTFLPGQWVDFHVPQLSAIGGYSITSTPKQLLDSSTIDLCVKLSQHPVVCWVHQRAQVGDQVAVRTGGTFTLAPDSHMRPCLFIAGGIGITALSSMILHLAELCQGDKETHVPPLLMYSAASPGEFARLPQLLQLHQGGALDLQLFTTQQHGQPAALQQHPAAASHHTVPLHQGRMRREHLAAALQQLCKGPPTDVLAFVCGPPSMTDQMMSWLEELGVHDRHTEKWW